MAEQKFKQTDKGPPPGGGGAPRGGYQKPKNTGRTIARLLGYLTQKKLPLVLVFLCVIVATLGSVGGSYLLRPILNLLVEPIPLVEKVRPITVLLLTLGGIYLAAALATYLQSRIMVTLAQHGTNRLRRDLFDRLQEKPLSYFDQNTHGELMSRFSNDGDNVQLALEQSLISLISSALMFLGVVVMMIAISWKLFIVTIITLLACFLTFQIMGSKSRVFYKKQQAALGGVNSNIQEMMEGLKVVKAFTYEEKAKETFHALNEVYRDTASDANFLAGATMPAVANIFNLGFAITAAVGGLLAVTGFDLGGLVTYLQYSRQIGQPMNQVSQQLTAILSALAGAERIFEMMDAPAEEDNGTVTLVSTPTGWAWNVPQADGTSQLVELAGAVRLTDVNFSYVPGKPVLRGVSVYADPGQKIAFVGSTGAGKTTITNLINRFYELDSGTITYDGIDVRDIQKESLRRSLGVVLQDTHLFTGTVMENIRYGRLDASDQDCIAAAKSANAHGFIKRLPQGYDTVVSGDGGNLSQGQRQLLAIARAAVANPPVMILDEATSSIDTRTEGYIQQGMDALMDNRTVFVIAHRLSTVRNANCIVVIEGGQIQEKGNHDSLLAEQGRYHQLYTGQFELD